MSDVASRADYELDILVDRSQALNQNPPKPLSVDGRRIRNGEWVTGESGGR